MYQIYFGDFTCINDLISNFSISEKDLEGCEIIYAYYNKYYDNYYSYAEVIFIKNGLLYEVTCSHFIENDLEGLWEPEKTTILDLLSRPSTSNEANDNLRKRFQNIICFL